MKKICFLFLFLIISNSLRAQISEIKRTNRWYFGEGIGIDFSSGLPALDTLSPMNQREACAVMSDTAGNLLFYTDGDTIWNKNHQMMINGFDVGCESSSNGAVIVPNPGSDSIYYLFTVDCWENAGTHGLQYTIINVNANGGTGEIIQKNIQLYSPSSEQLAVTRHCNGEDYWVVSHAYSVNHFYAHKVTANGVDTVPVITIAGDTLPVQTWIGNAGSMCFSPNGEKLCFVNLRQGCKLFDFDLVTGQLYNMIVLTTDSQYFGCAFSPDNSKLYITFVGVPATGKHISQYDLSSNDSLTIVNSKYLVIDTTYFIRDWLNLQLNALGIIYSSNYNVNYLCAILNPNIYGAGCNFVYFGLDSLNGKCKEQLPNINNNYYNPNAFICNNGMAEAENATIKYFPNPSNNRLTLANLSRDLKNVSVFAIDGRQIMLKHIELKDEIEIDIKQLPEGIYLVQLLYNNTSKIESIKFIKSNY